MPGSPANEPADRIVAATGRLLGYAIVTRDWELIPFGKAGHIETVAR